MPVWVGNIPRSRTLDSVAEYSVHSAEAALWSSRIIHIPIILSFGCETLPIDAWWVRAEFGRTDPNTYSVG